VSATDAGPTYGVTLDATTLDNIERSNIKVDRLHELMLAAAVG